jgi:hypothetical protein
MKRSSLCDPATVPRTPGSRAHCGGRRPLSKSFWQNTKPLLLRADELEKISIKPSAPLIGQWIGLASSAFTPDKAEIAFFLLVVSCPSY